MSRRVLAGALLLKSGACAGEPGEQSTMFLLDPSGNALEFKAFADDDQVFAR